MKKSVLAIVLGIIMIVTASCGGNKHSKAYNDSKTIIDKISESMKQAESCEDLDLAAIGLLTVLGVEGIADLSKEEQNQLSDLTNSLQKILEQKKEALGCSNEDFMSTGDETPLDEPIEEEE